MRPNDLKIEAIARETGMLYKVKDSTTEYSKPIRRENLTMEFQYETPDEVAHIAIYQDGRRRPIDVYTQDFEDVRNDYPQFFQD